MSWWVSLKDATTGEIVPVAAYREGGTYVLGGTDRASLYITYNYSGFYYAAIDGLGLRAALHGKRAGEVTALLEAAVAKLGISRADDYWEPTEGNAGYALSILLAWARQYPDAVFEVS